MIVLRMMEQENVKSLWRILKNAIEQKIANVGYLHIWIHGKGVYPYDITEHDFTDRYYGWTRNCPVHNWCRSKTIETALIHNKENRPILL